MKYPFYLFLGASQELPEELSEEGRQVIYCLEKFDGKVDLEKLPCLYLILVISKTQGNLDKAIALVEERWKEMSEGQIKLDLLTDNYNKVQKHLKEPYESSKLESVTFKLPLVAYLDSSRKSKETAKQLLLDSALKSKWQFWK